MDYGFIKEHNRISFFFLFYVNSGVQLQILREIQTMVSTHLVHCAKSSTEEEEDPLYVSVPLLFSYNFGGLLYF